MFEDIIKQLKITYYDFRHIANPNDPLAHLFNDWVDYYRLKTAIAHVLKPTSILEIGVRYGYSAAAFLNGNPTAHYVGIDLDTDSYGGVKGAINWAKEITKNFNTKFIIADTQAMERLPGDIYDLIHVDGQQDGDGSFHDLELAIKQARYILLDGYLWTQKNFYSVSDFLFKYSNLFDWYGVIPGYAGELIIKVSEEHLKQISEQNNFKVNSSLDIRNTYTSKYYTQDCSGFDAYKIHKGKKLVDPRLQAVAAIANLKKAEIILDIGCGRGELSYYFATQNAAVTAVDYSPHAIELAKNCFEGEEHLKAKVKFICDDISNLSLPKKYDLAIASDVIEHLTIKEVDALYQKIAQSLKLDGLFIIHTFPNLWYYKYEYQRKRRIAASVSAYLPPQPRSRYELIMHINEQSPRVLKKQLSQYFKYVYLWFGDIHTPSGSLTNKFSKRQIAAAPSLFAIASEQEINKEQLKSNLQMLPLPLVDDGKLQIKVTKYPQIIEVNSEFEINLALENNSEFTFNSFGPNPVNISYHWMDAQANTYIVFDGERTKIFPPLDGKSHEKKYNVKIKSLPEIGKYILRVTLVQEAVRWFDMEPLNLKKDLLIEIV